MTPAVRVEDERAGRRRVRVVGGGGLVYLALQLAIVVLVPTGTAQRFALLGTTVPVLGWLWTRLVRGIISERRLGRVRSSEAAARGFWFLAVGWYVTGAALYLGLFQALDPRETDYTVIRSFVIAVIFLGGLGDDWTRRKELQRSGRSATTS